MAAASAGQHAIDSSRAGRDEIGVHHHVRQSAIAFQRVLSMEGEDCLALPHIEPMVAGHEPIVLVDFAVPLTPSVELAHADSNPTDQLLRGQLRPPAPLANVIDDFIPQVMGYPAPV